MNNEVVEKLFVRYQTKGFLTNDEILEELASLNVSIVQTERICSALLAKGVLISDTLPASESQSTLSDYDMAQIDYDALYDNIIEKEPCLKQLVNYIRRIQPPQVREVEKLWPQICSGNQFARNRLFEMNMRTVLRLADKVASDYELSLSDTVQDGMIGLHTAIDKFDPSKHDKFQGYSTFHILNSMNRNKRIRDIPWEVPAHIQEKLEKIYKFLRADGFFETPAITTPLVKRVCKWVEIKRKSAIRLIQLLAPMVDIDEVDIAVHDVFVERTESAILHEQLMNILNGLTNNEGLTLKQKLSFKQRNILLLRFGLDSEYVEKTFAMIKKDKYPFPDSLTLDETGLYFGLTRERIRQIQEKALKRLFVPFSKIGLDDYLR